MPIRGDGEMRTSERDLLRLFAWHAKMNRRRKIEREIPTVIALHALRCVCDGPIGKRNDTNTHTMGFPNNQNKRESRETRGKKSNPSYVFDTKKKASI